MQAGSSIRVGRRHSKSGLNKKNVRAVAPLAQAMELRTLLSASVSGTVYFDTTGAGIAGAGSPTVSSVTVYADLNNNGRLDAGEPAAVTNSSGVYTIPSVPSGAQVIRQVVAGGDRQSFPVLVGGNSLTVGTTVVTGVNFDITNTNVVSGTVFNDANGNGVQDPGERGLPGITVLVGDSAADTAVSDSAGNFSINGLDDGTFTFTDAVTPGTVASRFTITLTEGEVVDNANLYNSHLSAPTSSALAGTVIGTAGSYNNSGNTIAKAFDGNLNNYVDGPTANGNAAGLDLGTAKVTTQISYAPRPGYGSRMVGGVFQGSDSADFSGAVTPLYTVTAAPASGVFTAVGVGSAVPFRYVRYLSPAGSYGDVGEILFTGYAPASGATLGSNGVLAVYGTNNADTVSADLNTGLRGNPILVNVNGVLTAFASKGVTQLDVAGLGGNDSILYTYDSDGTNALQVPTSLVGGDGDDTIRVNAPLAPVNVDGGAGNDNIAIDGDGTATVHGGDGNDTLGGAGATSPASTTATRLTLVAYGDDGNDVLDPGDNAGGTLYGGAGDDSLSIDDANAAWEISGGDGTDTFAPQLLYGAAVLQLDGKMDSTLGGPDDLQIDTDVENLSSNGASEGDQPDTLLLVGDSADNVLTADGALDGSTIDGGAGNDTLYADRAGIDTVDGGPGIDTAYVTPQDTVLNVENVNDYPGIAGTLTGTPIGTAGSNQNDGDTIADVFDGNLNTFFDGPTADGDYVGLDLGTAQLITQISYAPRTGYAGRMVGGIFQGSDSADFSGAVTNLLTVTTAPVEGTFNAVNVSSPLPFRYIRYLAPDGSFGDVAELKFTGDAPVEGATLTGDGTLTVYGTNNADAITVDIDQDTKLVSADINGTTQKFNYASVKQIVVAGLAGDDTINAVYSLETLATAAPITVLGGDGNDGVFVDLGANDSSTSPAVFEDGGAGADTLAVSGDGQATMYGGDGNDTLSAEGANQVFVSMNGGDGNDSLEFDLDAFGQMNGDAGNDTLTIRGTNSSGDTLSGGDGTDTFDADNGGSGVAVLKLDGANDSTLGSGSLQLGVDIENISVNDVGSHLTIDGSAGDNVIAVVGGDGATINGGAGNDTITVVGPDVGSADNAAQSVVVNCGSGSNGVTVQAANSTLNGGAGNDTLTSDDGDVVINGGGGNNILYAGSPFLDNATISGGTGNDTITTVEGDDINVTGGSGSNVISVGDGESSEPDDIDPYAVTITGGTGGDTLTGGAYFATINGGSGNDSIDYDGQDGLDIEAGNGNNSITAAAPRLLVNGGSGNDVIRDVTESVFGTAGQPTATLNGGAGNDTIYADAPDGDSEYPHTIDGGTGIDTAYIDPQYDTVTNVENVIDYPGTTPSPTVLTGTVIGTVGSYKNSGNTIAKAFDGNLGNYFDGPTADGDYAGLDLGSGSIITQISYAPRSGYASRMVGGVFQVSDSAEFSTHLTTLYTITATPPSGVFTTVNVTDPASYRYVRYLAPNGSYGDVGELQFSGYAAPSSGTLTVNGTSGNDTIGVNFDDDTFTVDVNGTTQNYSTAGVTSLVVNTLGGTNTVTIDGSLDSGTGSGSQFNISVIGGSGNDTLHTSIQDEFESSDQTVNVTFNGGEGNDYADIEGGDTATVTDGNGNDSFYTQAIQDNLDFTVTAGNGNDSIYVGSIGGSSSQYGTVNFGTGSDSFFNSDIDDKTLVNVDGQSLALNYETAEIVGRVSNASTGAGLSGVQVYLDNNGDGTLDAGDTAATTGPGGVYAFTGLVPDQDTGSSVYTVRLTLPAGFALSPSSATSYSLQFGPGQGASGDDFSLVPAAATGAVSGTVTSGGKGVANVTIYLDANNNSVIDPGELTTTTDANGNYSFTNVPAGTYVVRQVAPAGQKQTTPGNNYGDHVTVSAGSSTAGQNFVDAATAANTASIAGTVFNDANDDLKQDNGEAGLSGWTLYLDLNNSGSFVTGDPTTTTASTGNYLFSGLAAGTYIVRVEPKTGYSQTTPTVNFGQHETVAAGSAETGAVFGERKIA